MEATNEKTILERLEAQRTYFATGETRSISFRKAMLRRFRDAIIQNEKRITDAVYKDLRKSYQEAYLTEISLVLAEIRFHLKS
jgi:aldehyde dehydrogenase (NAD+)